MRMSGPGRALAAACAAQGLDLAAEACVGAYNERVGARHHLDGSADTAVLLIGNTRRLWPAFIGALSRRPELAEHPDPLDCYVEKVVGDGCAQVEGARVRWAHRATPAHISMQALAEVAGLAWRSPAALSVHPRYGPWIALRAAVVLHGTRHERDAPMPRPCFGCATGCEKRLRSLAAEAGWRDWLAVRDACPLGREFRYPAQQIAYHYTKSRALLRAALGTG